MKEIFQEKNLLKCDEQGTSYSFFFSFFFIQLFLFFLQKKEYKEDESLRTFCSLFLHF